MNNKKEYSSPQPEVETMYGLNHLLESTYIPIEGNGDFSAKESSTDFEEEDFQ